MQQPEFEPINVRLATEADLPAMLTIYNEVVLHTTAVFTYAPQTLEARRQWFEQKVQEGFPVFVAVRAAQVIGFCAFGAFRVWPAYRYTVELSVYVASNCRGQGVGKHLIPPLLQRAQELNMHAVIAGIEAENEASLRLHKHFGFCEVAHFQQVGYKFGRWLDLKFLQVLLPTPVQPTEWSA